MNARINAVTFGAGNAPTCQPSPTLQVEDQLNATCYSLDQLEHIVGQLVMRLTPVTGDRSLDPVKGLIGGASIAFVPLAERISYIDGRIKSACEQIESAVAAMQI